MQPKSVFVITKAEFGFAMQPNSVFTGLNIEFGLVSQPNSTFNSMNIEFGCGGRVARVVVAPPSPATAARR